MDALVKKQEPEKKNPAKQHFSRELVKAMAKLDYNQMDVSVRTDISKDMISRYCNGKALPKTDKLVMLARALKTTPDALLPIRGNSFKYAQGAQRIKVVSSDEDPTKSVLICSIPILTADAGEIVDYLTEKVID